MLIYINIIDILKRMLSISKILFYMYFACIFVLKSH